MRVAVDKSRCTSAGNCASVAPEVFDQREDDGVVILLQAQPPAELAEAAREAECLCPARAITVVDD